MDISKLMFRDDLMEGERILITGGGTGLGREMAEAFLKLGAAVHICGRRQGKLDDTASELMQRHGGTVHGSGSHSALRSGRRRVCVAERSRGCAGHEDR